MICTTSWSQRAVLVPLAPLNWKVTSTSKGPLVAKLVEANICDVAVVPAEVVPKLDNQPAPTTAEAADAAAREVSSNSPKQNEPFATSTAAPTSTAVPVSVVGPTRNRTM